MIELTKEMTHFIQRAGQALSGEGMPRIGAEIVALLVVTPDPLAVDEIAGALQVSRAAVSTNLRLLESTGIVTRTMRLGERCVVFDLGEDPFGRVLSGMAARMSELAAAAGDAGAGVVDPIAARRLARMNRFFDLAERNAEMFLAQWRTQ